MTDKISVLICTRNRPDTIGQAVASVTRCDHSNADIHVIDQSTTDATHRIVEQLAARSGEGRRIHYVRLARAGLSRAYNTGIAASDGPIIACTDDDVVVPTDWLDRIAAAFASDPGAGLLYGQVVRPASLTGAEHRSLVVPTLRWDRPERLHRSHRNFRVWGMGADMAMRRTAVVEVGGFDEALGGGAPLRSSQDYDLSFRIYRAGWAVLLDPDVTVDHYGARTRAQWPTTMRNYGIGDGGFYAKHVRCGDVLALRLLGRKFVRSLASSTRRNLRNRRAPSLDDYARGLFFGIREGARFSLDREHRLYVENAKARFDVTDPNAVTAQPSG